MTKHQREEILELLGTMLDDHLTPGTGFVLVLVNIRQGQLELVANTDSIGVRAALEMALAKLETEGN